MTKLSTFCQFNLDMILIPHIHLIFLMALLTSLTEILAVHPFNFVFPPKHFSTAILLLADTYFSVHFIQGVLFWRCGLGKFIILS